MGLLPPSPTDILCTRSMTPRKSLEMKKSLCIEKDVLQATPMQCQKLMYLRASAKHRFPDCAIAPATSDIKFL